MKNLGFSVSAEGVTVVNPPLKAISVDMGSMAIPPPPGMLGNHQLFGGWVEENLSDLHDVFQMQGFDRQNVEVLSFPDAIQTKISFKETVWLYK